MLFRGVLSKKAKQERVRIAGTRWEVDALEARRMLSTVMIKPFAPASTERLVASVAPLQVVQSLPAGTATIGGRVYNDFNDDGIDNDDPFNIAPPDQEYSSPLRTRIYIDLNHNNLIDADEPGATVDWRTQRFAFTNIAAGEYDLLFNSGDAIAPLPGQSVHVSLASGEQKTDLVFVEAKDAFKSAPRLAGYVYSDPWAWTRHISSEQTGLGNRTVYVDSNNNGSLDAGEPHTLSALDGAYRFHNLPAGTVTVRMVVPSGWTATAPSAQIVTLSNWTETTLVFLAREDDPGHGVVTVPHWLDTDRDGVMGNDEGSAQGYFYLDANGNAAYDSGEKTVALDWYKRATFYDVADGDYVVRTVLDNSSETFTQQSLADGAAVSIVNGCAAVTPVFRFFTDKAQPLENYLFARGRYDLERDGSVEGNVDAAELGNVWLDFNDNGIWDTATEPGNPASAVFENLTPGQYIVRVTPAAGTFITGATRYVVNVSYTERAEVLVPVIDRFDSIYGRVFADLNQDGAWQSYEPGLPWVQVYDDLNNNGSFDAAEPYLNTDGQGIYVFNYYQSASTARIRMVIPAGYEQTFPFNNSGYVATFGSSLTASSLTLAATASTGTVYANKNFSMRPMPPAPAIPAEGVLPGETATFAGGTVKSSAQSGYFGTGYADFGGLNSSATFALNRPAAAAAKLEFRYSNGTSANVPVQVFGNNVLIATLNCPATGGWNKWSTIAIDAVNLPAGAVSIKVVASTSAGGPNIDQLTVSPTTVIPSATLQGESGTFSSGTVKASSYSGYSGTGYADFSGLNSAVAWTVSRAAASTVKIDVRYANGGSANRPLKLTINGTTVATLNCAPTGGWTKWVTTSVSNI
jgi:hypothetical protein